MLSDIMVLLQMILSCLVACLEYPNPESEPLGSVRHNISRECIYGKGSSIFHIKAFRTLSKRLSIRISMTDSCSLVLCCYVSVYTASYTTYKIFSNLTA